MIVNNIGINRTFMGNFPQKQTDKDMQNLEEVMSYFDDEDSLIEILKKMNSNSNLKQESPYMYRLGKYELYVGSAFNIGATEENLRLLNKHNVESAPKLVASKQSKNKKYQMIAIESQGESKDYVKNKNNIPAGERRNFYEQIRSFSMKTGLYNPLLIEDSRNWLINGNGTIYIDDWSDLEEFGTKEEMQAYLDKLGKMCELTFG